MVESGQEGTFTFIAATQQENVRYHWYIDNVLVENSAHHAFQYSFLAENGANLPQGPGEYQVCLNIVSPDAREGTEPFCKTITVTDPTDNCPTADFTAEEKEPGLFEFSSDFSEEGLFYWYIDDVLAGDAGSNTFQYDFLLDGSGDVPHGAGNYDICLKIVTPNCQKGSELFCETITVAAGPCPAADFTIEESQPHVFKFTSQFSDPSALYYWHLDEMLSGDAAKDYFEYDFTYQIADPYRTGPGEYELCLEIVTPDCQDGSGQVCEVVTVEAANACPDPSFTTEETQNGIFKFSAAFDGNAIYYWYINGILAGDAGSNIFEYDFLINSAENIPGGPGDYDICLRMATPDCPAGSELHCNTITVN